MILTFKKFCVNYEIGNLIKNVFLGTEKSAINFIGQLDYITVCSTYGMRLKEKHLYYGQVQLGMAILNLKFCDFIIYSSSTKTFLNIVIPFNEKFAKKLICKITDNYFKNMIHNICENY